MRDTKSGASEWKRYWFLPIVAAMGYSTATLHSYGLGVFIEPIEAEFGWPRAMVSIGLTISGLTGALLSIPVGMLVDRFGPRRIGQIGVVAMIFAFGLLGTTTSSLAHWIALWSVLAIANLLPAATVWTKAVASRFEKSRGLAFAITLTGASVTATIAPLISTGLIIRYGWRVGFIGTAAIWALVVIPAVFLLFKSAQDDGSGQAETSLLAEDLPGATLSEAMRTGAFYLMVMIAIFYAFTIVGTTVHLVPILTDQGAEPLAAAGIVSLVGIFSLVGRVSTGFLLDRLPVHLLGSVICLLPAASAALLLLDGTNPVSQALSAVLLGLTVGGEIDVIAYLTTRKFGLKQYGMIFGAMLGAMNVGTATGPLVAGATYDLSGSYSVYLMMTTAAMLASCVALAGIGRHPVRAAI